MRQNYEMRAAARQQLKGRWGMPILACFLFWVIMSVVSGIPFGGIVVGGPLMLGLVRYIVMFKRDEDPQLENLFDGFKLFSKAFLLQLLITIFTFLWALLFIIPGIIASISYSQAYFILNDNPDMDYMEAIRQSKQMMIGYKGRYFMLCLSFIGWGILCLFTFGIGFLWLGPYVQLTLTHFYEDLKNSRQAQPASF
jgi:uncharacterized membrane protein